MIHGLRRVVANRRESGEDAHDLRREQGRCRALAGDVAAQEAKHAIRRVDQIEEVATNRARLERGASRLEEFAVVRALRQQRALDFRRNLQLVLKPRLVECLAIEARVLDRDTGLVRQGIERGAGVRRQQAALLAAVEIEHADVPRLAGHVGAIQIADQAERDAGHVTNAERDRTHVHVGEIAVEQVGDNLQLTRGKHLFRDLAAGVEPGWRQGDAALGARQFHFQRLSGGGQHDEAAFGAGHVDGGVEHESQHLIEHAARAERAQAFEQRRQLAQVVDGTGVRAVRVHGSVAGQEHHVGATGAAKLHLVAVRELVLGDGLAVDVGAVARLLVAQEPLAVDFHDLGMLTRDVTAHQAHIALGAPADHRLSLGDRDDSLAEAVVYFETRICHREWRAALRQPERPIIAGFRTPPAAPPPPGPGPGAGAR